MRKKQMGLMSFRLSDADSQVLEIAARLTGRSKTEYVRDVAVLCAVRFLQETGRADRLPAQFKAWHEREFEAIAVQDLTVEEKLRPRRRSKVA